MSWQNTLNHRGSIMLFIMVRLLVIAYFFWYNMFILAPVESRVERKRNQDPSHVFLRLVANFD